MRPRSRAAAVAALRLGAAGVLGALALAEVLSARASVDGVPVDRRNPAAHEPGEVVVVLGYASPERGGTNAIQRWRTRIAVRSADPRLTTFVFTGGTVRGSRSEAAVMAEYAVDRLGVDPARIVLEEESRSTWQNIERVIPLIADAPSIRIASNTFHARRARAYLRKQDPALAARLRAARDSIPGELSPVTVFFVVYELVRVAKQRRAARRSSNSG